MDGHQISDRSVGLRLAPLVVHHLPAAPQFFGRVKELETIESFWSQGSGIFTIVGVGGAGKTAILKRFVDRHLDDLDLDGAIVWSFYDDPDTNAFLRTTVRYLSPEVPGDNSGIGWYHSLRAALDRDKRYLIVLDGLERVQRATTDAVGLHGEMEDPLLRSLLVRLATSGSRSQVLVTSRFPLSDMEQIGSGRYQAINIDAMDSQTALELMTHRGVKGSPEELLALSKQTGRHALTLDLAISAALRFFDARADKLLVSSTATRNLASNLEEILEIFVSQLSVEEADLMSRICIFRFGVTLEAVVEMFRQSPEAAGSLATKSLAEIKQLAASLVDLHLVHLSGESNYTIHPAVRDHFYRTFRETLSMHGAITKHLLDLSGRPGIGLPTAKAALDLLEELVHHAVRSGNFQAAWDVYATRLGGDEHLNVELGEYSRCYRILSQLPPDSDPSALYHCYRSFGSIDEALSIRPQNTYVRLGAGDLALLTGDRFAATRSVALFLRGVDVNLPESLDDFPIALSQVYLCADDVPAAGAAARRAIQNSLFQDDVVRNQIALAEVTRRQGDPQQGADLLTSISAWVLRSGSCEHLAAYFITRGQIETDMSDFRSARTTFEEANQVCRDVGFKLFEVDCLVAFGRSLMAVGTIDEPADLAERALHLATASTMGYAWGECRALRLLADAALKKGDLQEAKLRMERLSARQKTLGLRTWSQTEAELRAIV